MLEDVTDGEYKMSVSSYSDDVIQGADEAKEVVEKEIQDGLDDVVDAAETKALDLSEDVVKKTEDDTTDFVDADYTETIS